MVLKKPKPGTVKTISINGETSYEKKRYYCKTGFIDECLGGHIFYRLNDTGKFSHSGWFVENFGEFILEHATDNTAEEIWLESRAMRKQRDEQRLKDILEGL